jgi:putative ABC transport system permease protein
MNTLKMVGESMKFSIHAVVVNKLRTFLSLLGITIGIFAIISVFTLIDSLEYNIRNNISSLGDNVLYVQKWSWDFQKGYKWWDYMKRPVPKYEEYEELKKRSSTAEAVSFYVASQFTVKYRNNSANNVLVWAQTQEFIEIRPFELESGRFFTPGESHAGRNVAVMGSVLASKLFQGQDPIGKEFKISGRKLTVIGIPRKEGNNIFGGGSLDNLILVPVNFARNLIDLNSDYHEPTIMIKAKPGISVTQLMDDTRGILRSVRRIKPAQEDNFSLNRASIINKNLDAVFAVINIVGWIVGIFSIIVGGFGIANIMFVSVKERTNIIGIQKALGAKNYFILIQFLFEAILLALVGGIVGLIIVFVGALYVRSFTDFHVFLSMGNILTGLTISAVIGVVSGFLPARQAARLNPVEAISSSF